jgi:D-alanyl-D-alanine endopeptidase (penicillin-binding protein 7)
LAVALAVFCIPSIASAQVLIPELKANAPDVPVDTSEYAAIIVVDVTSGKTIFKYNPAKKWPAASLTKLMTANVFTSTPTNWNATGNLVSSDEVGGGRLRLASGTTLSLRDILYSAIVGSANNAAQALARLFNGRGVSAFVQDMNRTAESLGLAQTQFYDASGMNPENISSAYDIAELIIASTREVETQHAMVTPYYKFVTRSPVVSKTIKNTNDLLFYEPSVVVTAGKTGYLHESQYNYVVRLHPKNDPSKQLVIVVFGAPSRRDSMDTSVALAKWAWNANEWKAPPSSIALSQNYRAGDRGAEIQSLQKFLNLNGFQIASAGPGSPGRETAYFGTLTRAALKRFQNANRAQILDIRGASEGSGYLDLITRAFIHTYKPTTNVQTSVSQPRMSLSLPPMGAGSVGSAVRTLQELLAKEADVYPERLITGYFGPLTKQAVQRFQLKHGIVSSTGDPGYGYVGPKTRAKLAAMYGL